MNAYQVTVTPVGNKGYYAVIRCESGNALPIVAGRSIHSCLRKVADTIEEHTRQLAKR